MIRLIVLTYESYSGVYKPFGFLVPFILIYFKSLIAAPSSPYALCKSTDSPAQKQAKIQ